MEGAAVLRLVAAPAGRYSESFDFVLAPTANKDVFTIGRTLADM